MPDLSTKQIQIVTHCRPIFDRVSNISTNHVHTRFLRQVCKDNKMSVATDKLNLLLPAKHSSD